MILKLVKNTGNYAAASDIFDKMLFKNCSKDAFLIYKANQIIRESSKNEHKMSFYKNTAVYYLTENPNS